MHHREQYDHTCECWKLPNGAQVITDGRKLYVVVNGWIANLEAVCSRYTYDDFALHCANAFRDHPKNEHAFEKEGMATDKVLKMAGGV